MINRRKQEIENCLKEIKTYAFYMSKSLNRDDLNGEEIAFKNMKNEMELMVLLYEELQRLRGE